MKRIVCLALAALLLVTASGCMLTASREYQKVEAVFVPKNGEVMDEAAWEETEEAINIRLSEAERQSFGVYADTENNRLVVEFDWINEGDDEMPSLITDLQKRVELGFYIGSETKPVTDEAGNTAAVPAGERILTGADVESAYAEISPYTNEPVVRILLRESGKAAFAKATEEQAKKRGTSSIWINAEMVSNPTVNEAITGGEMLVDGMKSIEEAQEIAAGLQGGILPFEIELKDWRWMDETGEYPLWR